jgi:release factor glutamine methyltransferase
VTVLELLQNTAVFFTKRHVENPRLNIEHLLADALGKKRIELYLEFDREIPEVLLEPLRNKVRRRADGEPLQHVLGHWDFFGRTFKIDRRALIPRPETELLVETVLGEMKHGVPPGSRLVDVGTGTGILAITFALEQPGLEVLGLDISDDALALARENADRLNATQSMAFCHSDLLDAAKGPFHWIVANLPYIATADLAGLPREVQFDPAVALDGGEDGLTIVKRLIESIPNELASNSLVALEIGQGQAERVRGFLARQNFRDITIKKDYQGIDRILTARYG